MQLSIILPDLLLPKRTCRRLHRYNRVGLASCTNKVTPNNPRDEYLISKIKACPTGFCRINISCDQVRQKKSQFYGKMKWNDVKVSKNTQCV